MSGISEAPWSGDASNYSDAGAYADACLINLNTGPRSDWTKAACKLPVKTPSGQLSRAGVHAAASALAGGRGGVKDVPAAAKKAAARKLISYYGQLKEDAPASIKQLAS